MQKKSYNNDNLKYRIGNLQKYARAVVASMPPIIENSFLSLFFKCIKSLIKNYDNSCESELRRKTYQSSSDLCRMCRIRGTVLVLITGSGSCFKYCWWCPATVGRYTYLHVCVCPTGGGRITSRFFRSCRLDNLRPCLPLFGLTPGLLCLCCGGW